MLSLQDKKYGRTRRELLFMEYVEGSKRGGIGQPKEGFEVGINLEQEVAFHSDAKLFCTLHGLLRH